MSKEESPEWKKELQDLIRSAVKEEMKTFQPPKPLETGTPASKPAEAHKHWVASDILGNDCPECKSQIDQIKNLGKEEAAKLLKDRAVLEYECVDCGTGVEREEKECPTCKGTSARKRNL